MQLAVLARRHAFDFTESFVEVRLRGKADAEPDGQHRGRRRGAQHRFCRSDTLPPVMTSHLSKYASLVPSLALIFAVADHVGGAIPVQYLHQAIAWAAYLRGHAERVFASSTNPGATHARALLAKIRTGAIADGFSARDVYRNQWSLLDREGVEAAVEMLCDLDHLRRVEIVPAAGGRPSAVFNINPKSKA